MTQVLYWKGEDTLACRDGDVATVSQGKAQPLKCRSLTSSPVWCSRDPSTSLRRTPESHSQTFCLTALNPSCLHGCLWSVDMGTLARKQALLLVQSIMEAVQWTGASRTIESTGNLTTIPL